MDQTNKVSGNISNNNMARMDTDYDWSEEDKKLIMLHIEYTNNMITFLVDLDREGPAGK